MPREASIYTLEEIVIKCVGSSRFFFKTGERNAVRQSLFHILGGGKRKGYEVFCGYARCQDGCGYARCQEDVHPETIFLWCKTDNAGQLLIANCLMSLLLVLDFISVTIDH
ncbi:hypothetical protein ABZP36_015739 [Zizania latifolia]